VITGIALREDADDIAVLGYDDAADAALVHSARRIQHRFVSGHRDYLTTLPPQDVEHRRHGHGLLARESLQM
jgi:hypothetical protein